MALFEKKKITRKHQPKTLKQHLLDRFTREVKANPELMRRLAFIEAGHPELLDEDTDLKKKQKEIKKILTDKALTEIQNDAELSEAFVSQTIEDIVYGDKPKPTRRGRSRHDEDEDFDGMGSPLSTIQQAIEDVSSLSELKDKLAELGLIQNTDEKGFLGGIKLADILNALPTIQTFLGKGNGNGAAPKQLPPMKTYIVSVDGKPVEFSEQQYLQYKHNQARITQAPSIVPSASETTPNEEPPIMVISPDAPAKPNQPELIKQEQIEPTQSKQSQFDINILLDSIDFSIVSEWLTLEPSTFVDDLAANAQSGDDEGIAIFYGFLKEMEYEPLCEIMRKSDKPEIKELLEKISTEEGKLWLETVLKLIKEKEKNDGK